MTIPYPLAAVIGHPIAHSRSPVMHRHWLSTLNLRGDYTAFDIAPSDLRAALQSLPALGFRGVNLTLPHKVAGLEIADDISDAARQIGAANTLTFTKHGLHADNTDAYGFMSNLKSGAPDWDATRPAVVLGAGGAARAILCALRAEGVPEIRLTNRSPAKAEALASEFGAQAHPWATRADLLSGAGLIVNTTSLGMTGQPPLDLNLDQLDETAVVTDIVYAPLDTPLLCAARQRGSRVVDGLGMLLHQGVPGFERWFGVRPTVTEALRQVVLG